MPKNTEVRGHGLANEGAPFDMNADRISSGLFGGTSGTGRAKCACGQLSDVYQSAYQRRAWHRQHKADVAAGTYQPFVPAPDPAPEAQPDSVELDQVWKRNLNGTEVRVTRIDSVAGSNDIYWRAVSGNAKGAIFEPTFRMKYTFVR
ncbi:hypothetical protein [Leifsonia sp. Leaf264]|uniref:hypothetical protein n=1 Tax=Leifsonia sp. Leaf264 TaxID=1736314 RepID=UPI0006F289CF|nr:hypothetical protein [Leifsonia sp. Leaf264]KQO98687.1 hypothetical protein ASF30_11535 [Leifsonia sp. Leaf264]